MKPILSKRSRIKKSILIVLSSIALFLVSVVNAQEGPSPYSNSESYQVLDTLNLGGGTSESESYKAFELIDELDQLIYESAITTPPPTPTPEPPTGGEPEEQTPAEKFITSDLGRFVRDLLAAIALASVVVLSALPIALRIPSGLPAIYPIKDLWRLFFGWFRRNKKFGIVFNSANGKGIKGVSVRLISEGGGKFEPGKLIGTAITDEKGYYSFKVVPGKYRIEVTVVNFRFPSVRRLEDYHGEIIDTGNREYLNPDIPVDSLTPEAVISVRSFKNFGLFLDAIRLPLMVIGTIIAIMFYLHYRATIDIIILAMYMVLWAFELYTWYLNQRISHVYSPDGPVHNATVRLLDFDGNLIATSVTQRNGEFSIFSPAGVYRLEVVKYGYKLTEKIFKTSESRIVSSNIKIYSV